MTPVVVVPVRSFTAMARLSAVLSVSARADLIRALAETALRAATSAGARAVVVTADSSVSAWARDVGVMVVADPGTGLDDAASAGVSFAAGRTWVVLHGDLPGVGPADVTALLAAVGDRPVLAPSKDGGTSAVAADTGDFPFRFGPGSFRRHLGALGGRARVVVRPGLAVDIDRPSDLAAWREFNEPMGDFRP